MIPSVIQDWWVIGVITLSILFQYIFFLIFCLFRTKRSSDHCILDESSELLSKSYRALGTDSSDSATGYDHAFMSCQYYIRQFPRLEHLHGYNKSENDQGCYWFSVKDGDLAKIRNKSHFFSTGTVSCIIKAKLQPKLSLLLRSNGPENIISIALDMLLTIKEESCPYIFPIFDARYLSDRNTLLLLNEYTPRGSLRDQMLGTKPFHCLSKASARMNKKMNCGKPLPTEKICSYTKQILMGLIFLDKLRFPLKKTYLWLHAGNLMFDHGFCKLSGYEVELLQLKRENAKIPNAERAGLASVGQIVFEMATGFPINYADTMSLDTPERKLTLRKKDKLREIHFEYLKMISNPEVLQLVQFLCDEDKCVSLHVSIHHPLFDQVAKFQPVEPENSTIVALKSLLRAMTTGAKPSKLGGSDASSLRKGWHETKTLEGSLQGGNISVI